MPTGNRCLTPCRARAGFTYLLLLLVLAIGGAGLAALGTQWRTAVQRDREIELLFRGHEIAQAIASYRSAVKEQPRWPRSFDDLLDDRRGGSPRRHLRRLYTDPFTGKSDWVLTSTEDGGFSGVNSRSEVRAYMTRDLAEPPSAASTAQSADAHSVVIDKAPPVSLHHFGSNASGVPIRITGTAP